MARTLTRTQQLLTPLRESIVGKPPYISGTLQLPDSHFSLFYKVTKDGHAARHINFSSATPDELEHLAQTCEQASSGENVLDDTYCKAGAMDSGSFSPTMDPSYTDMMNIIRECLLEGTDSTKNIKTELYKLNVYGRGSFVKPHIDTPRSEKMFGSLVIVLPIAHEGGALLLRRCGHEWIFDSGQALGAEGQPSIGYVAFFSGIEHEVAPVTSGRRITLTYSLYFDDGGPVSANDAVSEHLSPPLANKGAFREAFTALLENPEFLAEGGTLAFGLRHVYQISEDWRTLQCTYDDLKGSDAVVYQVVRALGYEPVLYMCYQGGYESAIIDEALGFERIFEESGENQITDIVQRQGGILVIEEGMEIQTHPRYGPQEQVEWVTPETDFNRRTSYYTDEAHEVASGDGDVCLVVRIGKTGDRLAYPTVAELNKVRKAMELMDRSPYYY